VLVIVLHAIPPIYWRNTSVFQKLNLCFEVDTKHSVKSIHLLLFGIVKYFKMTDFKVTRKSKWVHHIRLLLVFRSDFYMLRAVYTCSLCICKNDRLERDMALACSDRVVNDREGVLQGASFDAVPVFVRCHVCSFRLLFNSCSYGIVSGWCLYSLWTTCVKSGNLYLAENPLQSPEHECFSGVDKNGAACIPVHEYQLECHKYKDSSSVCSVVIR
jgi:hypothetical protein